jgi:hypothetical protein
MLKAIGVALWRYVIKGASDDDEDPGVKVKPNATEQKQIATMLSEEQKAAEKEVETIDSAAQPSYGGKYLDAFKKFARLENEKPSEIQPCNLHQYVQNLKVHFKSSASDSVVIYGNVPVPKNLSIKFLPPVDATNFTKVTMKVGYNPSKTYDNTLSVERQIIRQTLRSLIANNESPNVIAYYRDVHCQGQLNLGAGEQDVPLLKGNCKKQYFADMKNGGFLKDNQGKKVYKTVRAGVQKTYEDQLHKLLFPPKCDSKEVPEAGVKDVSVARMIVMEQVAGNTLSDLFYSLPSMNPGVLSAVFSAQDLFCIVLQAYDALACFVQLGVRHNDLHFGNVLIKQLEKPEDMVFEFPDEKDSTKFVSMILQTRYIVKIFDFDRGSVYGLDRNMKDDVEFCQYGECNGPSEKFDIAGFNLNLAIHCAYNWKSLPLKHPLKTAFHQMYLFAVDSIGQNNFNQFQNYTYPQLWLSQITMPDQPSRLSAVKTPLHCLQYLFSLVKPQLPSTLPSYYKSTPFRLPPRLQLHLGHPRIQSLGTDHYKMIKPIVVNAASKQTTLQGYSQVDFAQKIQKLQSTAFKYNEYAIAINEWNYELQEDEKWTKHQQHANWAQNASALAFEFYQRQRFIPSNSSPVFALACLTLTSPMYYGMTETIRRNVCAVWLSLLFNFKTLGNEQDLISTLYPIELLIWSTFQNILPVNIFLLYTHNQKEDFSSLLPIHKRNLITIPEEESKNVKANATTTTKPAGKAAIFYGLTGNHAVEEKKESKTPKKPVKKEKTPPTTKRYNLRSNKK